jgi:hypothetical protein
VALEYVDTRPENVSVNEPSSGTAQTPSDQQRMTKAVMQGAPPQPTQPSPPVSQFRPGVPRQGPPGIPAVVTAPTDLPGVPVNTPLAGTAPSAPLPPDQARIAFLDRLRNDPRVSPTTREWARLVLEEILLG